MNEAPAPEPEPDLAFGPSSSPPSLLALIIGVMRRMREGTRIVRHQEWQGWSPTGMLGRSIGGKRLGIIGMGRIGQAVAHRARAFGVVVSMRSPAAMSSGGRTLTNSCRLKS